MPRYKLTIEYDGTAYCGWQRQINGPTVQGALERAAVQLAGQDVTFFGAGRTDSGVHATGQVAHIDLAKERRTDTVRDAINANLARADEPVSVLSAQQVDDAFDARFSAKARHYSYIIHQRRAPLTVTRGYAWGVSSPLDVDSMNRAAQMLVGTHDFTTYRSVDCQSKSPVKTLDRLFVQERAASSGETWRTIEIYAYARSFLHSQVRSLAGVLKLVGEGRWADDRPYQALMEKKRSACGLVAPPQGLYLTQVDYEHTAPLK